MPPPSWIISGLLLTMTVVSGCSSRTGYVMSGPRTGSQMRSADIRIVDHGNPHDYDVIGRVHAHTQAPKWLPCLLQSQDQLLNALKREAALLHAEVIFDIKRYSRSQFEWQEEHLMGTAAILLNKGATNGP